MYRGEQALGGVTSSEVDSDGVNAPVAATGAGAGDSDPDADGGRVTYGSDSICGGLLWVRVRSGCADFGESASAMSEGSRTGAGLASS